MNIKYSMMAMSLSLSIVMATANPNKAEYVSLEEARFCPKKLSKICKSSFEKKLISFVKLLAHEKEYNRPQTIYEFLQLCILHTEEDTNPWRLHLKPTDLSPDALAFNIPIVEYVYATFRQLNVSEQYTTYFCILLYDLLEKIDISFKKLDDPKYSDSRLRNSMKIWCIEKLLRSSSSILISPIVEDVFEEFYTRLEIYMTRSTDSFESCRAYVYKILQADFRKPSEMTNTLCCASGVNSKKHKHIFKYYELVYCSIAFVFYDNYRIMPNLFTNRITPGEKTNIMKGVYS